ncbi:hypothetical protein CA54_21910 [Symmachiella macrocystis]|uniref:Uncharacterized protein n=1 Tax=Symmachiella macrocystis TaxID=2527985 RepID=A0A5C6BQ57_9PLAN|nr:hypothetical protein [Symmachiella macrocystis]TWU13356.1 hypothetical protein CA54_21910 [Symmachiella macrocystis]
MKNFPIVLHKPETVLRRGPAGIRSSTVWTQEDSDIVAHFIQVRAQISRSLWLQKECTFNSCGNSRPGTFPDLESFVYVAVYFRQLFAHKDRLFTDACDRYIRAVDSPAKMAWMAKEREAGLNYWKSPGLIVPTHTTEDLFNAMLYGTHLIHSLPATSKRHLDTFRVILNNTPQKKLLFEVHGSLRTVLNYVSAAAVVMHQDFAEWLNTGAAPPPEIMWPESVFLSDVVNGKAPSNDDDVEHF